MRLTIEEKKAAWWTFAAVALGSIMAMCLLFSCSPTKRLGGLAAKHPDEARKVCVAMFPPEITTVTNTEIIPGKEVIRYDTVTANCDTVYKWIDGKRVEIIRKVSVPCPPNISRTDTMLVTKTVTIENTAKIDVLSKDLTTCQADGERLKKGRNTWRYIALGALALLLGGAALKIFTKRLG